MIMSVRSFVCCEVSTAADDESLRIKMKVFCRKCRRT